MLSSTLRLQTRAAGSSLGRNVIRTVGATRGLGIRTTELALASGLPISSGRPAGYATSAPYFPTSPRMKQLYELREANGGSPYHWDDAAHAVWANYQDVALFPDVSKEAFLRQETKRAAWMFALATEWNLAKREPTPEGWLPQGMQASSVPVVKKENSSFLAWWDGLSSEQLYDLRSAPTGMTGLRLAAEGAVQPDWIERWTPLDLGYVEEYEGITDPLHHVAVFLDQCRLVHRTTEMTLFQSEVPWEYELNAVSPERQAYSDRMRILYETSFPDQVARLRRIPAAEFERRAEEFEESLEARRHADRGLWGAMSEQGAWQGGTLRARAIWSAEGDARRF